MKFLQAFLATLRTFLDQRGQVPLDGGEQTEGDTGGAATSDSTAQADQNTFVEDPNSSSQQQQQLDGDNVPQTQQQEETFLQNANLDPRKLPPEVQPIFKRMQGAYTKKMQEIARIRDQAAVVERFYNDRDFAHQTLAQWAAQNGFSIVPVGSQPQTQPITQQANSQVPAWLVEEVKQSLPPEFQWMADVQAAAQWRTAQILLKPLMQQQQQAQQEAQSQEWERLAEELSNTNPGWEEHEQEMVELLDFLQGNGLKHPKYGSKHQLLYNLVTGNAAATAQVTRQMTQAAKNRPASGIVTGRTATNLADRIRQAKSSVDAFRLAAQAAESKAG